MSINWRSYDWRVSKWVEYGLNNNNNNKYKQSLRYWNVHCCYVLIGIRPLLISKFILENNGYEVKLALLDDEWYDV